IVSSTRYGPITLGGMRCGILGSRPRLVKQVGLGAPQSLGLGEFETVDARLRCRPPIACAQGGPTKVQELGKYQLVRRLAVGGMAEVFLAKAAGPKGFEKTLVLKRILPHLAEDQHFVEMFLSEAKIAAQLNHPNIVQVYDFGEFGGAYYIAMEHIDGPNLRFLLRRTIEKRTVLPIPLCVK